MVTTKGNKQKNLAVGSLRLQPSESSILGRIISYIQKQPGMTARDFTVHLLRTRYLPFVLNKTEQNYTAVALQCAIECESWGRLIREYAGLPLPLSVATGNSVNSVNAGAWSAVTTEELEVEQLDDDDDDDDDDEMDEEERRIIARSQAHHAALFGHL